MKTVLITLRDCGTKQEHASEASARRAIRDWFLGYDFGDLKAPSKAAIRRAWSRVRGERDIESLASAMTGEVWSLIGKPADWCSYCAISVEAGQRRSKMTIRIYLTTAMADHGDYDPAGRRVADNIFNRLNRMSREDVIQSGAGCEGVLPTENVVACHHLSAEEYSRWRVAAERAARRAELLAIGE